MTFLDEPDVEPVPTMTAALAAHLYAEPHVHTPDGSCFRNRFNVPCDAPAATAGADEPKEGSA